MGMFNYPGLQGPTRSKPCCENDCCDDLGQAIIDWLEDADQDDINAFCEALDTACGFDGGGGSVALGDTAAIKVSGNGTPGNPYTMSVNLSGDPENAAVVNPTSDPNPGLFVANAKLAVDGSGILVFTDNEGNSTNVVDLSTVGSVVTQDTDTADLTGDGTSGDPLEVDVQVSADAHNLVEAHTDGLFAQVETDDSNTVDMTGDGTSADKLEADVKVSADAGNRLTAKNDGLFVPPASTSVETKDTKSVDLTGDGQTGTELEADVNISGDAGNRLVERNDGLYAIRDTLPSVTQISADYTLSTAVDDSYTIFVCTNTSDITITLPKNFGLGANIVVLQKGTGQVKFAASDGTLYLANPFVAKTRTKGSIASASCVDNGAGDWMLAGDLVDSLSP